MSFYTSISGLKNAQTDLSVIAHNIANTETNGFKKSRTDFADIIGGSATSDPRKMIGIGASLESVTQNFALGPTEQTGSALDLAINGDGFFATRSAETGAQLFTRNGAMTMDEGGFIQDGSDNRLQVFPVAADGTVGTGQIDAQVPATNGPDDAEFAGLTVGGDGMITATYADGSSYNVGQVALASFVAPTGLRQTGSSNWQATGLSGAAAYGAPGGGQYGALLSGSLERSNVDIAEELVGLITAQRNYQANAKAIDTASQVTQSIINLRT